VEETVVVLPADSPARTGAASGTTLRHIVNPDAAEGMGTSIACGLRAISPQADAAVIVMADMPEITSRHLDRLIAAFDPAEGRSIVRATAEDGTPGHPVLFGRRFFEALRGLGGDRGARDLIAEHPEFLVEVPLPGQAALCDLDTPEAWAAWRGVRPQGD
jgi:molybdenum cofactor cytidylyltransferase